MKNSKEGITKEIERKFLLKSIPPDIASADGQLIYQGYLPGEFYSVRVRIVNGVKAYLTSKGPQVGITREENEVEVSVAAAKLLLGAFTYPLIIKTRYILFHDNVMWSVDHIIDADKNELWIAEVELKSEDQEISIPDWVDREVTHDKNYYSEIIALRAFEA